MNPSRLLGGLAVLILGLSQTNSQTLRPPYPAQTTPASAAGSRYFDVNPGN
jgi:hypothetical protein